MIAALAFLKPVVDNPVTRWVAVALLGLVALLTYGKMSEAAGARKQKIKTREKAVKVKEEIAKVQTEAVKQADDIRDDTDTENVPDYHFRED